MKGERRVKKGERERGKKEQRENWRRTMEDRRRERERVVTHSCGYGGSGKFTDSQVHAAMVTEAMCGPCQTHEGKMELRAATEM